jgi:hypothetical protein
MYIYIYTHLHANIHIFVYICMYVYATRTWLFAIMSVVSESPFISPYAVVCTALHPYSRSSLLVFAGSLKSFFNPFTRTAGLAGAAIHVVDPGNGTFAQNAAMQFQKIGCMMMGSLSYLCLHLFPPFSPFSPIFEVGPSPSWHPHNKVAPLV